MMEWKPNGTSAPIMKTSNLIVLLGIFKAFKKGCIICMCVRVGERERVWVFLAGPKYAKRMQMNITINTNNAVKY